MLTNGWPTAQALTTERLDLEPLTVEHAGEMVTVLADPALYEFTGGRPPSKRELIARYTRQARGASPDRREGWLNWVPRLRSTGGAVGTVQATLRDGGRAELAWALSTRHQGRGYATEAVRAVMEWLRSRGIESFEAHINPSHEASKAVARRVGLEPTDTVRGDGEVLWTLNIR